LFLEIFAISLHKKKKKISPNSKGKGGRISADWVQLFRVLDRSQACRASYRSLRGPQLDEGVYATEGQTQGDPIIEQVDSDHK
jgi:hypothetical protein